MDFVEFFKNNYTLVYQSIGIIAGLYAFFIFSKKTIMKTDTYKHLKLLMATPVLLLEIKEDQRIIFTEFKLHGKIISSILDTLEIAQMLCDANGMCIKVNPKWVSLTGLTEEEAKGHNWLLSIHHEDRELIQEKWLSMLDTNSPFEEVFRYKNRITDVISVVKCSANDIVNEEGARIYILGLSRVI